MKHYTWKDITVDHYQSIYTFIKDDSLTEIEKDCKIIGLLYGIDEAYIDNKMTFDEFKALRKSIAFLYNTKIEAAPVNVIEANGNLYEICFDVRKVPIARYAEVKHFAGDEATIVRNLHLLIASMVRPVKKRRFPLLKPFYVALPYEADKHEQYANDLLAARFPDVWYAMVFFCNLYANWMRAFRGYSESSSQTPTQDSQTPEAMIESQKSRQLVQALCSDLDGYIRSSGLPIITGSPSMKPGTWQHLKRSIRSRTSKATINTKKNK